MFKRNQFEISQDKSKEFRDLMKSTAKNSDFWEKNKKDSLINVPKEEMDRLFCASNK